MNFTVGRILAQVNTWYPVEFVSQFMTMVAECFMCILDDELFMKKELSLVGSCSAEISVATAWAGNIRDLCLSREKIMLHSNSVTPLAHSAVPV